MPFYCTEHGKNHTHNTANCMKLKKQKKPNKGGKTTFSNKGLKKEINFLSHQTPKDKVLDMYMAVILKEKAKLEKARARKAEVLEGTDSDSKSDMSIALIEQKKAPKIPDTSDSEESSHRMVEPQTKKRKPTQVEKEIAFLQALLIEEEGELPSDT